MGQMYTQHDFPTGQQMGGSNETSLGMIDGAAQMTQALAVDTALKADETGDIPRSLCRGPFSPTAQELENMSARRG